MSATTGSAEDIFRSSSEFRASSEPAPVWASKPGTPKLSTNEPQLRSIVGNEESDWQAHTDTRVKHAVVTSTSDADGIYEPQSRVEQIDFTEAAEPTQETDGPAPFTDAMARTAKSSAPAALALPAPFVPPTQEPQPIEPTIIETPDPTVVPNPIIQEAVLERMAQVPPEPDGGDSETAPYEQPAQTYQLGRINDILPYTDYEPDPQVARDDPCLNLCPRPDKGCPPIAEGRGANLCPPTIQLSDAPFEGRLFSGTVFCWEASNICYHPLYFEDPSLERYGHTHSCLTQPFVSAGRFSAQFLALPYQMSIDPMCSCRYPLGYYRPGECAPKLCYQPPWNFDAALATAGFYTGMTYLIP